MYSMEPVFYRKLRFKFDQSIPKHWMDGSVFKTHLLNSFTLIFPTGEKFFIRTIAKHINQIDNQEFKKIIQAFIQQESQHSTEHERFFEIMKNQGYSIDSTLNVLNNITTKWLEPFFGPKLNLSITASLEHFTALLSHIALTTGFLNKAEPNMKKLFEWHAAEEIEHRSVAFDVLQAIDKSYSLRVGGLINAYVLLVSLSTVITLYLIYQDKRLLDKEVWVEIVEMLFLKEGLFLKSIDLCIQYLHPDFHPSKLEQSDSLANEILNSLQSIKAVS